MAAPVRYSLRYARTNDDLKIAFWAVGEGYPLVIMPSLVSHVEQEWDSPRKPLYEHLSENWLVVRYDGRGQGLSSKIPLRISLDAQMRDLEAVANELGLRRFALLATSVGGPAAIAFTAAHPGLISHLILWNTFPKVSDLTESDAFRSAAPLLDSNWDLFLMTASHARMGWYRVEEARRFANGMRNTMSPNFYRKLIECRGSLDATALLDDISVPTLILQRSGFSGLDKECSRLMAAKVRHSQLRFVEGDSFPLDATTNDPALIEIEEFLQTNEFAWNDEATNSRELTIREADILRLVASGLHNKEIASQLGVSRHTIERHVANIYTKVNAHSRAEATAYAIKMRFYDPLLPHMT
jgi:DNA-binding CsgD family transcriptional regulator/pimeloyl-ACP methyl ester carboxylesterase